MKFLRRLLVLVLPLLLLTAQHGALAHALSHFDRDSTPVPEKSLTHLKLCGKCLSGEKLSHFAGGGLQPVVVEAARYRSAAHHERGFFRRWLSPYLSRAPPLHP